VVGTDVPSRAALTEDDERAEAESRDRLHHAQGRLRELRDRRGLLLDQVRRLSDEQRAIHDRMAPERDQVEGTHFEYRELGHQLADLRARRDHLRGELDRSLAELRMERPAGPKRAAPPARPDQIRREMALLERRQQTQALPLTEENALIDRLRQLRKELEAAEKVGAEQEKLLVARREKERAFQALREEFDRIGEEIRRAKEERDHRMASLKAKLAGVGQDIAQIREKARLRQELFQKVDEVNRQMAEVDREIRDTLQASRARRQEARELIQTYSRSPRAQAAESSARSQTADEQLERLMKNGKITLGG
jgi:uncharacterized coiled-coil DUF342 family protein